MLNAEDANRLGLTLDDVWLLDKRYMALHTTLCGADGWPDEQQRLWNVIHALGRLPEPKILIQLLGWVDSNEGSTR